MATGTTGVALAAIAAGYADEALRALGRARDRDKAVHRARKAIRKLRCALALGGASLGSDLPAIDMELKTLVTGLSVLRDACVVVQTARHLAEAGQGTAWQAVADRLEQRRRRLLEQALIDDPGFAGRRRCLEQIAVRMARLPWDAVDEDALRRAIEQSRRRLEKAAARAASKPSAARQHRWRRRVRRLRLQLAVIDKLQRAAPALRDARLTRHAPSIASLARLADRLGWRQDLYVLRRRLKTWGGEAELTAVRCARIDEELRRTIA